MKRKLVAPALGLGLAALALTGCGNATTLQERAANKAECESYGGKYIEYYSEWTMDYSGWRCDLESPDN